MNWPTSAESANLAGRLEELNGSIVHVANLKKFFVDVDVRLPIGRADSVHQNIQAAPSVDRRDITEKFYCWTFAAAATSLKTVVGATDFQIRVEQKRQ